MQVENDCSSGKDEDKPKEILQMELKKNSLLMAAAVAGLLTRFQSGQNAAPAFVIGWPGLQKPGNTP